MNKKSARKAICAAFCVVAAGVSTGALATAHLEVAANAIQIQTYGSVSPVLFYTGSVSPESRRQLALGRTEAALGLGTLSEGYGRQDEL